MESKPIISLTTIPDRIGKIGRCIESLLSQGLPVHLWVVRKIARSDTILEEIPCWLAESGVSIEIVEDRGPITKLLPALKRHFELIITADDDMIYGKNWASQLLEWSCKRPQCAISLRGRILTGKGYKDTKLIVHNKIKKPKTVDIITGVRGALYRASFFDRGIYSEWKTCPTNDDLVIAAHLRRRGFRSLVVPARVKISPLSVQYVQPLFETNRAARDEVNNRGIRELRLE